MNILLKLFGKETLWKELIRRENFNDPGPIDATTIWRDVFGRTPELSKFLKRREIVLLKNMALQEKAPLFVLGQIAENRFWQSFDIIPERKKEELPPKKVQVLPTVDQFLKRKK